MRGRKTETNSLLLLLLFLSTLWDAQEQIMKMSCLNWNVVSQCPKCLPAWRKGCCNSYWDVRCSQARTSEEKRKINLLFSETDCAQEPRADHLSVCCVWVQVFVHSPWACTGHIWALVLWVWAAGVVWGFLPQIWVGVYEVMAGCPLGTAVSICFTLCLWWMDGNVQPAWLGGLRNHCKESW